MRGTNQKIPTFCIVSAGGVSIFCNPLRRRYSGTGCQSHPLAIAGGLEVTQGGDGHRVRDQVDRKIRAVGDIHDIIDGEANALDGDRAFAGDVACEGLGGADYQQVRFADGLEADDRADAIDMAADQMAAEATTEIYALSLHDALPISSSPLVQSRVARETSILY